MDVLKYRLGLDLGTNSIGWCVVELNDQGDPFRVVSAGSRIFSSGRNAKNNQSNAVARRAARQQRRQNERTKRRKTKLLNALTRYGFLPSEQKKRDEFLKLQEPLALRSAAVQPDSKISVHQLGRAIYHLNQHRGFLSNRRIDKTTNSEDAKETSAMKAAILGTEKRIAESEALTIGDYLYKYHALQNKPTRFRTKNVSKKLQYDVYINRAMIEHEFNLMWETQKKAHEGSPEHALFTDETYNNIHETIFHQRPLRPQTPGNCSFFPAQKRAPLANSSTQKTMLYSRLNVLKIKEKLTGSTRQLTVNERNLIIKHITGEVDVNQKPCSPQQPTLDRIAYPVLRKLLFGVKADDYSFLEEVRVEEEAAKAELNNVIESASPKVTTDNTSSTNTEPDNNKAGKKKKVVLKTFLCDKTAYVFTQPELLGNDWYQLTLEEQDRLVELITDDAKTDQEVLGELTENYQFTAQQNQSLLQANLVDGYSHISRKAYQIIYPVISDSANLKSYNEAVTEAKNLKLLPLSTTGESTVYNYLPYYGEILQSYTNPVYIPYTGNGNKNTEESTYNKDETRYGRISNPTVHVVLNQLRRVINQLIRQYGKPAEIFIETTRDLKKSQEERSRIHKQNELNHETNATLDATLQSQYGILKPTRQDREKLKLWYEQRTQEGGLAVDVYTGRTIPASKLFTNEIEVDHILPYSRTFDDRLSNKTLTYSHENRSKTNKSPFETYAANKKKWAEIQKRANAILPIYKQTKFADDAMNKYANGTSGFLNRQLNDTAYVTSVAEKYLSCLFNETSSRRTHTIPGQLTGTIRHQWGLNSILNTTTAEGVTEKNRNDHRHHAVDAAVVALTDRSMLQKASKASSRNEQLGKTNPVEFPVPWEKFREELEVVIKNITTSHKQEHGVEGVLHEATSMKLLSEHNGKTTVRISKDGKKKNQIVSNSESLVKIIDPETNQILNVYKTGSNYCYEIWEDENGKWQGDLITTMKANSKEYKTFLNSKTSKNETFSHHRLIMRVRANDIIMINTPVKSGWEPGLYLVTGLSSNRFSFSPINMFLSDKKEKDFYLLASIKAFQACNPIPAFVDEVGNVYCSRS